MKAQAESAVTQTTNPETKNGASAGKKGFEAFNVVVDPGSECEIKTNA